MGFTHATAVRNAVADAVVDLIDAGAGSPSTGRFEFHTSGAAEVATNRFLNPAFGAAAAGVATANAIDDDTAATGGTTDRFVIKDVAGTILIQGLAASVTDSAASPEGDILVTGGVVIGAGATVQISSLTYTAPA